MKDYYAILGITPTATGEEIRAAFRQQAKRLHPDYYRGDSQPFREAQEAWDVLSDPAARRAYDAGRPDKVTRPVTRPPARAEPLVPRPRTRPPEPIDRRPAVQPLDAPIRDNNHIAPVVVEVRLSPQLAAFGGTVSLPLRLSVSCPACGGGRLLWFVCRRCGGRGWLVATADLSLRLPPGLRDGDQLETALVDGDGRRLSLRLVVRL